MTDRLELLQSAAHALREAAATPPEQTPPLAQLVEDTRSLRIVAEAAGILADALAAQLGAVVVSNINTSACLDARSCASHSSRDLVRIAATLQAAEINLARIQPAPVGPPDVKLTVVPHDVDKCQYCTNPKVRSAVLAEQETDDGWLCSKCGWATVDLGTMHEQLWPTVNSASEPAIDMVCPGCGAEGAFVDYPPGD